MIAWVSPSPMVSVTPLRISLAPSSVSTVTCRSLISSVLICVSLPCFEVCGSGRLYAVGGLGHVDVDAVLAYLDGERRDRLGGREPRRLAAAQVEAGAVQPALDLALGDLALAQGDLGVGAEVLHGEEVVAVAGDRDVEVADGDGERLVGRHLLDRADSLEGHQASSPVVAVGKARRTFLASSASTVSESRASICGTSMRRIRSLK